MLLACAGRASAVCPARDPRIDGCEEKAQELREHVLEEPGGRRGHAPHAATARATAAHAGARARARGRAFIASG